MGDEEKRRLAVFGEVQNQLHNFRRSLGRDCRSAHRQIKPAGQQPWHAPKPRAVVHRQTFAPDNGHIVGEADLVQNRGGAGAAVFFTGQFQRQAVFPMPSWSAQVEALKDNTDMGARKRAKSSSLMAP